MPNAPLKGVRRGLNAPPRTGPVASKRGAGLRRRKGPLVAERKRRTRKGPLVAESKTKAARRVAPGEAEVERAGLESNKTILDEECGAG